MEFCLVLIIFERLWCQFVNFEFEISYVMRREKGLQFGKKREGRQKEPSKKTGLGGGETFLIFFPFLNCSIFLLSFRVFVI